MWKCAIKHACFETISFRILIVIHAKLYAVLYCANISIDFFHTTKQPTLKPLKVRNYCAKKSWSKTIAINVGGRNSRGNENGVKEKFWDGMIKGKKKMSSRTEAAYQHQHARYRTTNTSLNWFHMFCFVWEKMKKKKSTMKFERYKMVSIDNTKAMVNAKRDF